MAKKKKRTVSTMDIISVNMDEHVQQGDIFKNVKYIFDFKQTDDSIEIVELTFPYVLIVSQSCDMLHASRLMSNEIHSESKLMFSVLAVPMYERETIISGEHLKELCDDKIIDFKINSPFITDEDKKVIKDGFHYRFHEIYFSDDWKIPDSIIDLKGFFTLNLTTINQIKGQRIGRLNDWSSQQIVNKMSAFLSRVGLPEGVSQEKTIVQNQQ